jgi:hypothetical protein
MSAFLCVPTKTKPPSPAETGKELRSEPRTSLEIHPLLVCSLHNAHGSASYILPWAVFYRPSRSFAFHPPIIFLSYYKSLNRWNFFGLKKIYFIQHCFIFKQGDFFNFFFYVLYSTLLHLPRLRFYYIGGCWDRTQDCCDFSIGSQSL